MTGADGRSVGELLLDADHTARELLIDAPDLDAAVVLRTWGEVVETATDLWAALPAPPAPAVRAGLPRGQWRSAPPHPRCEAPQRRPGRGRR